MDGSFKKIVNAKNGDFSIEFIKYTLLKVVMGLRTMHKNHILHRDIKKDNILLDADGNIKLADLGFSKFLSEQKKFRQTQLGTPSYISPEIV